MCTHGNILRPVATRTQRTATELMVEGNEEGFVSSAIMYYGRFLVEESFALLGENSEKY